MYFCYYCDTEQNRFFSPPLLRMCVCVSASVSVSLCLWVTQWAESRPQRFDEDRVRDSYAAITPAACFASLPGPGPGGAVVGHVNGLCGVVWQRQTAWVKPLWELTTATHKHRSLALKHSLALALALLLSLSLSCSLCLSLLLTLCPRLERKKEIA